jgi:hypothetical protein
MEQDDFLRLLRASPFRPFQVHLTDGAMYEIRHPEQAAAGFTSVSVAVQPHDGEDQILHVISLLHITRLVPLG